MPDNVDPSRSRTYESASLTLLTIATALLAAMLFVADVPSILNPVSEIEGTGTRTGNANSASSADANDSPSSPPSDPGDKSGANADNDSSINTLTAAVAMIALAAYAPLALAATYAVMHDGEDSRETERRKRIAAQSAFGLFLFTTITGAITLIISIILAVV